MIATVWGVWSVSLPPDLPATSSATFRTGDHILIQAVCLAILTVAFHWFFSVYVFSFVSPYYLSPHSDVLVFVIRIHAWFLLSTSWFIKCMLHTTLGEHKPTFYAYI